MEMKKVIFVSACKTKNKEKGPAREMYTGQFAEKAYKYAVHIEHDNIFFQSTEFCLVEPEQEVRKINKKFTDMPVDEKREWAEKTINQLKTKGIDLENDELLFLTPKNYWCWIAEKQHRAGKSTQNFKTPLVGLRQGEQIGWITERLRETGE